MSNLKTLTTFAIATLLAAPAFAQEAESDTIFDPLLDETTADFISADLDQNGSLNADEFVSFAVMRAEDGEEAFKDIVMGGEYNTAFASHDTDTSGGIEPAELAAKTEMEPAPDGEEVLLPQEEDSITPDN